MSLVAAAVAGGAMGARHALETDHLAAVATLVDGGEGDAVGDGEEPRSSENGEEPRSSENGLGAPASSPALVGASWGIGHTVPITALGATLLAFGVRLPASVTGLFEAVVGVVLCYLGGRMLAGVIGRREHAHGTHPLHGHFDVGTLSLGGGHVHVHGDSALVGALHGVAGSGALVIALVSTTPDLPTAASFLGAFGLASVLTMAAVAAVWGRTLDTGMERALRAFAGALGVVVGLLLVVEWAGLVG
ncbi:high-affinity nickel-transporter protein [Haloplanus salinarum]|uniref:high-affinity nickel-transporter protein n=1 Tax=Haloplanus salinarum TaxID=1912324 RepID=UPI00214C14AE|nr:high-affinity nickel-transporter protein [Haloplanus salinarum]